jgi:hypothetical protein
MVLQESELALHGGAATVEAAPAVGVARDADVALALLPAERNDCRAATFPALGVDAVVVVALWGARIRFWPRCAGAQLPATPGLAGP